MVNKVILVGFLGRDAELRHTPSGAAVATLSLATSDVWTGKDGSRQERTEWHRIQLWGKQADTLAEYLVKGKQLFCEGRIQTHKWKDKDGADRFTTEVRADRIVLLGSKGMGERALKDPAHVRDEDVGHGEPSTPASDVFDSDIPF